MVQDNSFRSQFHPYNFRHPQNVYHNQLREAIV